MTHDESRGGEFAIILIREINPDDLSRAEKIAAAQVMALIGIGSQLGSMVMALIGIEIQLGSIRSMLDDLAEQGRQS